MLFAREGEGNFVVVVVNGASAPYWRFSENSGLLHTVSLKMIIKIQVCSNYSKLCFFIY